MLVNTADSTVVHAALETSLYTFISLKYPEGNLACSGLYCMPHLWLVQLFAAMLLLMHRLAYLCMPGSGHTAIAAMQLLSIASYHCT